MSWNIQLTGTPASVRSELHCAMDTIATALDRLGDDYDNEDDESRRCLCRLTLTGHAFENEGGGGSSESISITVATPSRTQGIAGAPDRNPARPQGWRDPYDAGI